MLDILTELIKFPSDSSNIEESDKLFNYLAKKLSQAGMLVERHVSKSFPSIVATTSDTKKPKLMLQAHMDTVPAPDRAYKMVEKNGRLYGRGVYDMKFAAACYLQLVKDLKDELDQYDFGIMLTSDEEVGGENGVAYLLEQGYSAEVCVLPDGGDDWKLETICNGIWLTRLVATGEAAHGSRPWEGENAIVKLVNCLSDIQAEFGASKPYGNTLTISQIQGGAAINQVPGQAEATLDMRFPEQASYQKCREDIEQIVSEAGLQLETVVHTPGVETDVGQPYVAKFIEIAEQVRGRPMETCHSLGATDARYFCAKGIPTIVIRPTGGGHHGDNEWVDKAELLEFYEVLKAYVKVVAKI